MNRNSLIALAALAAALFAVGCSSDTEADAEGGDTPAVGTDDATGADGDESASAGAEMTLAGNAYVNDDGVAVCPVRDNAIPDLSTAAGSQEYEDKTYYFC